MKSRVLETGSFCPYINDPCVAVDIEFLQNYSWFKCRKGLHRKTVPKENDQKAATDLEFHAKSCIICNFIEVAAAPYFLTKNQLVCWMKLLRP